MVFEYLFDFVVRIPCMITIALFSLSEFFVGVCCITFLCEVSYVLYIYISPIYSGEVQSFSCILFILYLYTQLCYGSSVSMQVMGSLACQSQ